MKRSLLKIEGKRNDMLNAAIIYGLNSEKTIKLSQELDDLLNTYYNSPKRISDFTGIQKNAM